MSRRSKSQNKAEGAQEAHSPDHPAAHDRTGQTPTTARAGQAPPKGVPMAKAEGAQNGAQESAGESSRAATGSGATPPTPAAQKAEQVPPTEPAGQDQEDQEQRHGPIWSASEAARRCGIGRATMTRRLQAGAIPGATRDEDGHWQVPLSGLLAAGLHPDRPAPPEDDHQEHAPHQDDVVAAVELAELRGQLAVERARREAAEQLAAERAARIEDLRHALRAIEPPIPAQETKPQANEPAPAAQEADQPVPQQPEGMGVRLRRWWRGR